jgi:hypothetical protein
MLRRSKPLVEKLFKSKQRKSMDMMLKKTPLLLVLIMGVSCAFAQSGNARKALNESGQASGHAGASAGHGILASGQVTSAAIAVPLSVGGAVLGAAATIANGAADSAMNAANAPIGQPLPVTDRVITTMPPSDALNKPRVN